MKATPYTEPEYICEFCGHKQTGTNGSYLCPNCHHGLSPASWVRKKRRRVRPVFVVLLIITLLGAGLYLLSLRYPNSALSSERFLSSQSAIGDLSVSDNFEFINVKRDIVKSSIDGTQYFLFSGEVKTISKTSLGTTLELTLSTSGKTIYSEEIEIGMLTPFRSYEFLFEVNLDDLGGIAPGAQLNSRLEARGRSFLW